MSSSAPDLPLVVVGASLAGLRTVESARRAGYSGPVTLIGDEPHLPYDRPPLSKAFLSADTDPAPTTLRTWDELDALGVELILGAQASALDVAGQRVRAGDRWFDFSSLVIATGAAARHLPDERLTGVHTLRTLDDAVAVRAALDSGARTVVIGGGFIGSEVASAASERGLEITIVEAAPLPLVRAVGERMATAVSALHAKHGTTLLCGNGVSRLLGESRVTGVELTNGQVIPADLVVVGIGAEPNTSWLIGSGLTLADGVVCTPTLRAAENVYAAGDVCRWTNPLFGSAMRLEHWTSAAEQGAAAARNALDPAAATAHSTVPYFWSDWYGQRLQMVGLPTGDEVLVVGGNEALEGESWLALYRTGDLLTGALSLNLPGKIMKYKARIAARAPWTDALEFAGVTPLLQS